MQGIVEAMEWLGLSPDEPPSRQTQFAEQHAAAATGLLEGGFVYGCDCTRDQIDGRIKGTDRTGYDGHCRDRGLTGPGLALRFRVPDTGTTVVPDAIRGDVAFPNHTIEDFVVVRSSGQPLFALSNLVDDRAQGITHVIRGEEHLANTPKQLLLAEALDQVEGSARPTPVFAHLPLLVNEQRKKLSKRRDPVAVESYRDRGYLPDAFVNFLGLLGWSPRGDEEIVPRQQMVEQFALEDVNHSPAFFDVAKLTHMNGAYIRAMPLDEFVEACGPWVDPRDDRWRPADHVVPWPREHFDPATFESIAPLVQERVATLDEVPAMVDFLFLEAPPMDPSAYDKAIRNQSGAREVLSDFLEQASSAPFDAEALHALLVAVGERHSLNLRKAQAPVRVAITGRSVGPPLFESMSILGRDKVLARLAAALRGLG